MVVVFIIVVDGLVPIDALVTVAAVDVRELLDVAVIVADAVFVVPVTTLEVPEIIVVELVLDKVTVGTVPVMTVLGVELDICVVTIEEPMVPEKREQQSLQYIKMTKSRLLY